MKLASMANYQQDGIISVEYDPATGTGSAKVMINGQEINIGGGSTMLKCTYITGEHLDKTVGEIYDAFMAGSAVLFEYNTNETGTGVWGALQSIEIYQSENIYGCSVTFANNMLVADQYDTLEELRAAYPVYSD